MPAAAASICSIRRAIAWTADYLKITGELDVDLRSNIAAEARAKIVYERLINFCDDAGTKDALQFLMTREITHMKAFAAALESMGKPAFSDRQASRPRRAWSISSSTIPPAGRRGRDRYARPWNEGGDWEFVDVPGACRPCPGEPLVKDRELPPTSPEGLSELLLDELRDILHAEKQLTKALPKMAKAARFDRLRECSKSILLRPRARSSASTNAFRCSAKPPAPNPARA